MNRRNFCKMLCALPFLPAFVKDRLLEVESDKSFGILPLIDSHFLCWPESDDYDLNGYEICRVYDDGKEEVVMNTFLNWVRDDVIENVAGYNVYAYNICGLRVIHYQERFTKLKQVKDGKER